MKKEPRYYQKEAYSAIISAIGEGERPYVSMSTGSGKSMACAMLAEKALKQGVRALILVPTSELVAQNFKEHFEYTDTKAALGICSAKLMKTQVNKQIVYATYTSFLRRRTSSGAFNLLILDEAHYCSPDENTSYQKIIRSLLRLNPAMKIVGLTATPYRADQGMLHEDSVKGKAIFTKCVYETSIPRLIEEGYLSHVESISGDVNIDLEGVKMKGADYDSSIVGVKFDAIVVDAVKDMRLKIAEYNIQTAIIYTSTLDNARKVMEQWGDSSTMRLAYGDMPQGERNALVRWIKEGAGNRYVVNVGLFVTGFDHRQLDCVVLFMATKSLVKYVQIAGRVIRAHDDKERGYVLDYGSNIERHGPIDATIPPRNKKRAGDAPKKMCLVEGCGYPNLLSAKYCKECGALFVIQNEQGLYSMRTKAEILSAKVEETHQVDSVMYVKAYSNANGKGMIKALLYGVDEELIYTHYICLEHDGFAGDQAERFIMSLFKTPKDFYKLGNTVRSVDNMLMLLNDHPAFFKDIKEITLKKGDGRYKQVKSMRME